MEHYGPILIDFKHINDAGLRHCFKNVATRLTLKEGTIKGVRQIAYRLLSESAGFQAFLKDMHGREKPMPDLMQGKPLCRLRG